MQAGQSIILEQVGNGVAVLYLLVSKKKGKKILST